MGSSTAASRGGHIASGDDVVEVASLRWPGERRAFALAVVVNLAVLAFCVSVILAGTDWLATHPFFANHLELIRSTLLAALVAVPAMILGRQASMPAVRGGGVRVGADQFPELHDQLVRACKKLRIEEIPALYVSHHAPWPATAHSARGRRPVVVINARLFAKDWKEGLDWLSFVMAGALGSIRLGHTRWWVRDLERWGASQNYGEPHA